MAHDQPRRDRDQVGDMARTDEVRDRGDARKADESNLQRGEYGIRTATGTDTDPAATFAYGYYGSTGTAGYGIPGGSAGTFGTGGGNATGTYGTTGDTAGTGYGAGTGTYGTTGTGGTTAGYGHGTGGGNTGYGSNFGGEYRGRETTTRRGAGGDRNRDKDRDI